MAAEFYIRNSEAQWRKAKEFYYHNGNEWKNITQAWFYDGTTWQQVFQYTAPSSTPSDPTGPVRPTSVASSGTYVSSYPATPNNSFDTTNPVVDTASLGEWRVDGQTGNTVIWTWASGSNSYTSISLNVRLAISNLTSATTTGTECAIYGDWSPDPPYNPTCLEYRDTTISSPATIVFAYSLDGGSNYTNFKTYTSGEIETTEGTITSGDITSGLGNINTDLSNLKVRATINCPTGADDDATANLTVYDVWANSISGVSATPPTVSFTASSTNVANGTSINLISAFSPNGVGVTITGTSTTNWTPPLSFIPDLGATVAVIPANSTTTTYTLTVTDSNSNSTTKQVSVTAYALGATSPTMNLGSGNGVARSVQLGTSVNLTATWSPGSSGQSVVSVTSGSASDAGLSSPWTPSSSPGYYTVTPIAVGTYTFTNTLNGSSPTASAVLTVTAPTVAPITPQLYYPSSKSSVIYTDNDGSSYQSTSIKVWADYGAGTQGTATAQWEYSTNNSTWSNSGSLVTGIINMYPIERVVDGSTYQTGYYRVKFVDTVGAYTSTTYSDSFYIRGRYRYKPTPASYKSRDGIAFISRANPGVLTLNQPNSLNGTTAYLSGISGMTALNGQTVTLTGSGSTYTIGINTSGFSDFQYNGSAQAESVVNWDLSNYTVDWRPITSITGYPTRTVTSASHGFSNGQSVLFTGIIGMTELNSQLLTVSNSATNTFDVSLSGLSNTYVSGGYAIGASTSANAGSINPTYTAGDLINDDLGYVRVDKVGLIKFPSVSAYSARIIVRAGWTYNGFADTLDNPSWTRFGIHDGWEIGAGTLELNVESPSGSTNLLAVSIPKDPNNGSTPSSSWSETIVNSNYTCTLTGLTNLNEITLSANWIDAAYNRSFEVIGDPTDSHRGQIDIYDVYVIYNKSSGDGTIDSLDTDLIFT